MAGFLSDEAREEIRQLIRAEKARYQFQPRERYWRPIFDQHIGKGITQEPIDVDTTGEVEIYTGDDGNETATGVIITCKNYYHNIAQNRWCHFVLLRANYGELIAGRICD